MSASAPRSMQSGRRVVHVTTADISLALLLGPQLRAFAEAGYEVIGASAPGPFVAELESWGIEHVALRHTTRSVAPHRDLAALRELYQTFRRLRPAIVHTHNPKPGVYGRIAARAARVPGIVNTVHGLYAVAEDSWRKRASVYTLERVAAACSHAELVQNREDLDVLRRLRVPERKLHLLGNGIDLSRFDPTLRDAARAEKVRAELGASDGDVLCGAVGRLVWEKGYRELFNAAAALRERVPKLRFVVVGPTDPDKRDAVHASDLEMASRRSGIVFTGMRDDVEDVYAALDLYVLASHREGFPRSAMEASAMGVPVVATDIRGCRQVVDDEVTGLLVPPRDAHALADAIERVALDGGLRRRMGEAGRRKALLDFDQQQVIERTLAVYEALTRRLPA